MEYSLEELKVIAGCDIKKSEIPNLNCGVTIESPLESLNKKLDNTADKNLEGLANRLNSLLGSEFSSTIKIDRL